MKYVIYLLIKYAEEALNGDSQRKNDGVKIKS
jgi:hypothetical protein